MSLPTADGQHILNKTKTSGTARKGHREWCPFFVWGGDTIKKYEKEILQSQLNDEKAVLKQLEQNYQQAIKDIDDKVAALLGRADADAAHVVYQIDYQRQLRTQVQSILEQLQANEFETISEYLTQCYEEGFMGSLYSMQQQGVPLAFPINQEQVVMAVLTDSKIKEDLYTSLGKDIAELKKNISAEIARGISTSLPYAQIAKNLERKAQIGLNRAMRITRTEGGRIQNKAAMDTMFKAKEMGADVVKRWSAALDARTRDSHAKIDGEIREVEEKFSNGLMYPKDPSGKASEVVNCRCKVQEIARWALTANQTKMLGDTSQMTDEQKEAIANRLGIPVEDLDKYSGQIVPINAKSYDEFKKRYKEIWNYEGSDLQKEAEARIAGYKKKSSEKTSETSQKALENSENSGKIMLRKSSGNVLKSIADPLADVFGAGADSHPQEIKAFREELKREGVNLTERAKESLGYCPSLTRGSPGTVYISEGASYGAWLHEMQHMRDDRDAGWLGMGIIADPDRRYEWEVRAYNLEIEFAMKANRPDIAEKLRENLEAERKHIYGE